MVNRRTAVWIAVAAGVAVVVVVVVAVVVWASVPRVLDSGELVGTWHNPNGASLALSDDGKFLLSALPSGVLDEYPEGIAECPGNWSFGEPAFGYPTIELTMCGPYSTMSLYVRDTDTGIVLYSIIGDPDSQNLFDFTKATR